MQHPVLRYSYKIVDRIAPLRAFSETLLAAKSADVAVDIEALVHPLEKNIPKHLGDISLIQMCCCPNSLEFPSSNNNNNNVDDENKSSSLFNLSTTKVVNIIDVLALGKENVREAIQPIIESKSIRKIMFDCRRDVEAFSSQLQLRPQSVLDIQLLHVAIQWKLKASDRRSGLQYVLKQELGLDRQAGDAAVSKAMLFGNRPVWDVRPLPEHFLEYAADDVRHLCALFDTVKLRHESMLDAAARLSEEYTNFYAQGKYVEEEADVKSHNVRNDWLERYCGPAGVCAFCGVRGHHQDQCFKKGTSSNTSTTTTSSSSSTPSSSSTSKVMRCSYCGSLGHVATNCFKKHPQMLKCKHCGQMGHNEQNCYQKNPCEHCGGKHKSENCLKKNLM